MLSLSLSKQLEIIWFSILLDSWEMLEISAYWYRKIQCCTILLHHFASIDSWTVCYL